MRFHFTIFPFTIFGLTIFALLSSFISIAQPALKPEYFDFSGKIGGLGSDGATLSYLEGNTYLVKLGHAPTHTTWPNKLNCFIRKAAKGVALRLVVQFDSGTRNYAFNEYFQSYSYDRVSWKPIQWRRNRDTSPKRDTLDFPAFTADSVWIGTQVPFSYQDYLVWQNVQTQHPDASFTAIGKSEGGQYIYRLSFTASTGNIPESKRWGLYFASQHPGEHNAHRRMQGMVDYLTGDSGKSLLEHTVCHFIFYMSPDAPAKGWYRVVGSGQDMNRTFSITGSDPKTQPTEAVAAQRDLERIVGSPTGLDAIWSIHTWPGMVDISVSGGNERDTRILGGWQKVAAQIKRFDDSKLIKPIYELRNEPSSDVMWASGPAKRYKIPAYLCEGGGSITSEYDNRLSGWVIMKALSSYYNKPKP